MTVPSSVSSADAAVVPAGVPRWLAIGLVAGIVMYIVPSAMHGNPPVESAEALLRYVAERPSWRLVHLVNIAAVVTWGVTLVELGRRLTATAARGVARAATVVVTAAAAVFAVYFSIHAMALPVAAQRFVSGAVDPGALLTQVEAVLLVLGATAFTAQGLVGASIGLFGLAVALDRGFPRWIGVLGTVGGLGWLVGALLVDFAVIVPFTVVCWAWTLLLAVILWRRSAPAADR